MFVGYVKYVQLQSSAGPVISNLLAWLCTWHKRPFIDTFIASLHSPERSIALTKVLHQNNHLGRFAYIPNYTRIPFLDTHTELVES